MEQHFHFDSRARRSGLASALGLAVTLGCSGMASAVETSSKDLDLGTVIVSANRAPTDQAKVGSSVTVIGRDELEKNRQSTVKDYLDRVPGLNFTQNGPPGAATTLEMRGAYAGYVLVRIDGIDISDPSSSQVSAALEHLLTGDVERIEILRGSQSALYGGTAVGGVIDITTRTAAEKGVHHTATLEAGSYGTVSGRYGLSAATDTTEANVSVERLHSDGFSAANSRDGNSEKDGYENTTFSANASTRLSDAFRLFGATRYSRHDIQFDDFTFGVGPTDEIAGKPRDHTVGEDSGTRLGADFDLFDGRLKNTIAVQYYWTQRDTFGSSPSHYEGDRKKVEYLGSYRFSDMIGLSFGADHAQETAKSSSNLSGTIDNTGLFGQISLTPLKGLTLTAALRDDHHSLFGDHPTHRLTAAYEILDGTKLRTSWGTGYRPPSVYELYAPTYGNTALKPETSTSFDVGVDQRFWGGRASASVTWFSLDTTDLIGYDPATFRSIQVAGVTRRQGVELSGKVQAFDWLGLDAGYTYTEAHKADGSRLVRVPRNKATLGATATPFDKTSVSLRGTWVTGMVDTDYSVVLPDWSSPVRELPSYFLLDATISYRLTDTIEATLRGKNLLDRKYETVWGYGTQGASVYAGLTARF
jgi:vitamin B12 transporter